MQTGAHHTRSPWSLRPHFTPRQLLSARHLNAGFDDELRRERLLNRALHGQGVVFGFGLHLNADGHVEPRNGCLELTCGVAIDRHGRILYWPGGSIGIGDLADPEPHHEGRYILRVHYAERPPGHDGCWPQPHDDAHWQRQGVVFSAVRDEPYREPDCPPQDEGVCLSVGEYLGQRTGGILGVPGVPLSPDLLTACEDPGPLCPTDGGRWVYDADGGIPLAVVRICDLARHRRHGEREAGDETGAEGGTGAEGETEAAGEREAEGERETEGVTGAEGRRHDDCDPCYGFCAGRPEIAEVRPFAYRAPQLYELLNCCDTELARVAAVSWQDWLDRPGGWHRRVPWHEFQARIRSREEGFCIWFTKPVRRRTLHQASVVLTAVYEEARTDYWVAQRVPLDHLEPLEILDRDDELAMGVRLVPSDDWLAAETTGRHSTLFNGAQFEVTVRGQLVRDECGRVLDARAYDAECGARCQALPGGDFISAFQVAPRPGATRPPDDDDAAERRQADTAENEGQQP